MPILTVLAALTALVLLAATTGLAVRHRQRTRLRRASRLTGPDAVDEGRFVEIGGVPQWLRLRGEHRDNPVLLVVHGGPGSPYSLFTPRLRAWERYFTVVQWDRRGSGRTLGRTRPATGELTFERMVDDGVEVAEFLRRHLGQERIVLLAGSMGTIVGLPMALRRPDLFSAYVTTDVYVDLVANETEGRRLTLEQARTAGRRGAVRALERLDEDPTRWTVRDWGVRMQHAMALGPTRRDPMTGLIAPLLLTNPEYTLRDAWTWLRGFAATRDAMFEQFMRWDARALGDTLEVPFVLVQGASDGVTLTGPALAHAASLRTPSTRVVQVPGAGHFCAFTHPEPFLEALLAHVPRVPEAA